MYEGGEINDTIPPHQLMIRWLEVSWAMVFIDNIDIERPGYSLYEGGDINDTIPPPADDKMVGGDTGNNINIT